MADLRKANKLWISDSIHLRNVLYIPIENAARAKEYILESKLLSLSTSDENKTSPPNPSEPFAGGSSDASPQSHATPSNLGTIRRVPATQLSFFPPPSQSPTKTASKRTPFDHQGRNHLYNSPSNAFGRYATVPSHSLTSLLTALPISASTRDTIMARLSFDSTSSGTSESRPSDLDDALHERHELSDVHPRSLEGIFGFYPKNGRGPSPSRTPKPPNSPPPKASGHPASYHPRSALTPSSYIPTRTQVRTVQLEPSPIMELPLKAGSSRRAIRMKSQPNLLDGGVELRGTRTEA
ncbi:hypothetical protein AX16_006892 [Volvariella volvacea WC 439]|nr:hypothetical protein AX16_006892 [Volvariella volvacea WC 439]